MLTQVWNAQTKAEVYVEMYKAGHISERRLMNLLFPPTSFFEAAIDKLELDQEKPERCWNLIYP